MAFRCLQTVESVATAPLCARGPRDCPSLPETAPADRVMVDFCREPAVTVDSHQRIDAALGLMQNAGVRALLVMADGRVSGLITAYDIQGEKPIQFVQSSDCIHHPKCRHEDVEVSDIMTPIQELPMLQMEDLANANVGNVLETFRQTGHTHLLVMESLSAGETSIRGLISRAQVERQLGIASTASVLPQIEREITRLFPSVKG